MAFFRSVSGAYLALFHLLKPSARWCTMGLWNFFAQLISFFFSSSSSFFFSFISNNNFCIIHVCSVLVLFVYVPNVCYVVRMWGSLSETSVKIIPKIVLALFCCSFSSFLSIRLTSVSVDNQMILVCSIPVHSSLFSDPVPFIFKSSQFISDHNQFNPQFNTSPISFQCNTIPRQ